MRNNGFTLVELILVIVIIGIIGIGSVQFIRFGADVYASSTERDEVVAQARFALLRITKELRRATPNSIRLVTSAALPNPYQCLEFAPFVATSIYLNNPPLDIANGGDLVVAVFNNEQYAQAGDRISLYSKQSEDIYDVARRRVNLLNADPVVEEANRTQRWSFDNGFATASPTQRVYALADSPVSLCVEGNSLYFYQGYNYAAVQPRPNVNHQLAGVQGQLLAQYINNTEVFDYTAASLTRNALVNIALDLGFNDSETLYFNHEVHIPNVP